ncbi:hypothetical protein [Streptomyces sp. NPDC019890]|uniref:hypothetical protein n=1 Tax=Streptomyces sp. NPDC019890 TaxID=3365064 RepID=UPI00384C9ABB
MGSVLLALIPALILTAGFWGPALIARTRWGGTDPNVYPGSPQHAAAIAAADDHALRHTEALHRAGSGT